MKDDEKWLQVGREDVGLGGGCRVRKGESETGRDAVSRTGRGKTGRYWLVWGREEAGGLLAGLQGRKKIDGLQRFKKASGPTLAGVAVVGGALRHD